MTRPPKKPGKKPKATRPMIEARLANVAKARAARWHGQGATPAMVEANRRNAQLSTGPRTEEGKAATCRNGWKHGRDSRALKLQFAQSGANALANLFGKPCKTTCPMHPDNPDVESPCSLVLDGLTRAGKNCLDKTQYINALAAISNALESGEMSGVHAMLAAEGAKVMQILQQLSEEVATRGVLIPVPIVTKDGHVIREDDGTLTALEYRINPALPHFQKMLSDFGISLPEMLATPAAREKAKTGKQASDALSTLMGQIAERAGAPRPNALPVLPPVMEE
jgi:hypothetical protein